MLNSLQGRIVMLVGLGVVAMGIVLGVFGFMSVRATIDQVLEERLALAETVAGHLGYILEENLNRLAEVVYSPGVDLEDNDLEPERKALPFPGGGARGKRTRQSPTLASCLRR